MLSREKHQPAVLFLSLQIYINKSSPVSTEFAKGNFSIVLTPFSLHCNRHAVKTAAKETRPHCITLSVIKAAVTTTLSKLFT